MVWCDTWVNEQTEGRDERDTRHSGMLGDFRPWNGEGQTVVYVTE